MSVVLVLLLCAAAAIVVPQTLPLRLRNTVRNELGAYTISYPGHWQVGTSAFSTTIWELYDGFPRDGSLEGNGAQGYVVGVYPLSRDSLKLMAHGRLLEDRGDVLALLAEQLGFF